MTNGWRTIALLLGAVCTWQAWNGCTRSAPRVCPELEHVVEVRERVVPAAFDDTQTREAHATTEAPTLFGVKLPPWSRGFLPQSGEDLRAYRDRMLPLAQLAIAPQRARIARSTDDITRVAHLDERQRGELEGAARDTASAIEERVIEAVLSGDLSPTTFKPMAGVAIARDLLDLVDRGNKRFVASLRDDQRTALADHPFDFADYLVFSTRWEDAISAL